MVKKPKEKTTSIAAFAALGRSDAGEPSLARLATGGAGAITELAEPFGMSQPAISKHPKLCSKVSALVLSRGRDAQSRPCRLEVARMKQATEWMERYRRFWDESFDRLAIVVDELKKKETAHARKK